MYRGDQTYWYRGRAAAGRRPCRSRSPAGRCNSRSRRRPPLEIARNLNPPARAVILALLDDAGGPVHLDQPAPGVVDRRVAVAQRLHVAGKVVAGLSPPLLIVVSSLSTVILRPPLTIESMLLPTES